MKLSLPLSFLLILTSCAKKPALLPSTEYVLCDGMTISADTPNGRISVTGGKRTQRIFSGDGWTKTTYLTPRTTRWYGSLGLYDPADSWSPHGRLLVDEGRLFFDTESEALRYFYEGSDYFKPVFNSRGLVVGFHVENIPGGEPTRSVQIWQIYIKGKVPDSLRGPMTKRSPSLAEIRLTKLLHILRRLGTRKRLEITNMFPRKKRANQSLEPTAGRRDDQI